MKNYIKRIYLYLKSIVEFFIFKRKIRHLGGVVGKPLALRNPQYIFPGRNIKIKDGYRIECYDFFQGVKHSPVFIIEDNVIINYGLTAFVADSLKIGKDTILAGNITLITENHGIDPESDIPYHAQRLTTGPIIIGEGCWLGQNVSVLPNVKIGNRCIIATNAVVTSDIPDFCIAAGCPARIIKKYNFQNHFWEKIAQ